jgi:ribulose 1,5-bisphosphate synthetase/thiazole synthase
MIYSEHTAPNPQSPIKNNTPLRLDVAIVGAGLAGLYALYRLRALGFNCQIIEAGSGVGALGFGIATPARVAISRAFNTPTPSLRS